MGWLETDWCIGAPTKLFHSCCFPPYTPPGYAENSPFVDSN